MSRKEILERVFQGIKVFVCLALTLTFFAVAILEIVPTGEASFVVRKKFVASSSRIYADGSLYQTEIRGTLENTQTQPMRVEGFYVIVSDGKTKKKISIDPVVLSAKEQYEFVVPFRDACDFDRVSEVHVLEDGTDVRLSNRSVGDFPITGIALVCILLTIGSALLLTRSIRTCYYLYQERHAKQ
ncbi:MAG: hypothetical protein E7637_05705 [Ruminococcaceae bacterium]|nr:hypothetical protein [Oscillospiraceae bacterium]